MLAGNDDRNKEPWLSLSTTGECGSPPFNLRTISTQGREIGHKARKRDATSERR